MCLRAFSDLSDALPNVVKKLFEDIFILMGKIYDKKDFADESIRVLSFEILISIVEKRKELLSKDIPKIKILIEQNFKYALEIEESITKEWMFPKGDSFMEEEIIEEEKIKTSLSFLERLIKIATPTEILPFISECILTLLKNTVEWKFRYVALMTLAQIAEHIADLSVTEPVINVYY